MAIFNGIDELVGKTPLFRAKNIEKLYGLSCRLLLKLEYLNPAGSVKDRAAKFMLDDAEEKGLISSGATIIEPTSGNTGIGLAAIGGARGYKVILTMPETMSVERIKLLEAYGAKIVLTDGKKGMQGAVEKANEINKNTPNSVILGQFDNPANPQAHYQTTAPEIWQDTEGKIDVFVAGIGTGGTISGTARFLKEKNPFIKVYGVEPSSSPLITKGVSGSHKIQGIGANFLPANFDKTLCTDVLTVENEQAFKCARELAKKEGILVGISSGAALFAAIEIAQMSENKNKTIVALMPDTGDRYLSTELFSEN